MNEYNLMSSVDYIYNIRIPQTISRGKTNAFFNSYWHCVAMYMLALEENHVFA